MERDQAKETFRDRWRKAWPILLGAFIYMIPLFWLWHKTDYPDSLGVHFTEHGEAGLLESWWYSYLLIERHGPWDIVAFVYMWAVAVGLIGWIAWIILQRRKTDQAVK